MEKDSSDKNRHGGFTLTELLTTVATIGVLGSLLLPVLAKAKHNARDVQCLNNQRSVRTVLESDYQDVVTDYNQRYNPADIDEINDRLRKFCSGSLMRDPYLGGYGVFAAKPVTCPYAFGDGKTRAGFSMIFQPEEIGGVVRYIPFTPQNNKEVKYVTYTYELAWNFMDSIESHFTTVDKNSEIHVKPIVADLLNKDKPYIITVKKLLPWMNVSEDKTVILNDSVLHPHKGRGRYATYVNGKQKWEKSN